MFGKWLIVLVIGLEFFWLGLCGNLVCCVCCGFRFDVGWFGCGFLV